LIKLRSHREIQLMRNAGALLAKSFVAIFDRIQPRVATKDIDAIIESVILEGGAKPAFKGYPNGNPKPFPFTSCISVEDEVVHGMPSKRSLKKGQIVGIDAGLVLDGWYADMACSFLVGNVDETRRKLWWVTREALYKGIDQARSGNYLEDVSGAIQDHVEKHGFGIIRDLVGHGIGRNLHEEPQVLNYRHSGQKLKLRAGMTIAIEPMVSVGNWRIKILKDGWTAVTIDGSPSGHFEHTVHITDGDPEIMTLLEDGRDPWAVAASIEE